ncbi:hypothetical protein HRbin15_01245 [bacterium HR15]|nr:hypothetical protein HRbin15_01245 [bacterium HR15]
MKLWTFACVAVRLVALSVGLGVYVRSEAQSIRWLPEIGRPYGISPDGRVVVGVGSRGACRWTAETGTQFIVNLPLSGSSEARSVSADGSVVVGTVNIYDNGYYRERGFVWRNGEVTLLNFPVSTQTRAYDVSADGSIVVGGAVLLSWSGQPVRHAFRWTAETGMQDLGPIGYARAIAANGRVIVAGSGRWIDGVGYQDIGIEGVDTSADGSVIISYRVYWTESGGTQGIGGGGDVYGIYAYGLSGDGRVVVGGAMRNAQDFAFRWTPETGMVDLNIIYASLLGDGSKLLAATAVSQNGRYIVGYGRRPNGYVEAFLLDTCTHSVDVYQDGCVDDLDVLTVLFRFGASGSNVGRADVNCDEVVDDADLLMVLFNFGSGC